MNKGDDFRILQEELWYRIPVSHAPKRFPPEWLPFYQTKEFKHDAFAVNNIGHVREIHRVKRRELFPNEFLNSKSENEYFQIHLESLERLPQPIYSARWRRILFIPTTLKKIQSAREVNDLFDDSPLEDLLWQEFKRRTIDAERQWNVPVKKVWYQLDFALFCDKGQIDVEVDGDTWHANRQRAPRDNRRNNNLVSAGWNVLRFSTRQIREEMAEYCIPEITKAVKQLGGLKGNGIMPRTFYDTGAGVVEQLALFDSREEYELD
jgi:very-short-patch-repair endonuclease